MKNAGCSDVSGRVDRMFGIQFRQFVMSLKFIDDKIGEIGFKAKSLGEVTITVILF